jgi:hypothetical protein
LDTSHLIEARALLREGKFGFTHKGLFPSLCADVQNRNLRSGFELQEIHENLQFLVSDLWNMLAVCSRLEWMKGETENKGHVWQMWTSYATADIEYWHIKLRSILDYVAATIRKLADRKDQVTDSFSGLFERCSVAVMDSGRDTDFIAKLGLDWLDLLRSATWYPTIREIRDQVIHWGGRTMVFWPPSEGILFQIRRWPGENLVEIKPLMFNNNVVYFERYAAHTMAHFLLFLERFAGVAYKHLAVQPFLNGMNRHFGLGTVMLWIDSTLEASARTAPDARGGTMLVPLSDAAKAELADVPGGNPALIVGLDE